MVLINLLTNLKVTCIKALTLQRYRYCRMLEEGSFRGRTADFVFMFLFGAFIMTVSFLTLCIYTGYLCVLNTIDPVL
jgi:hypothetical protein